MQLAFRNCSVLLLIFLLALSGISGKCEQKLILQNSEKLIQFGFLLSANHFSRNHPLLCFSLRRVDRQMPIPSHLSVSWLNKKYQDKSARHNYRATKIEGQQSGDTTLYILFSSLYPFHHNNFNLCYLLGSK